MIRRFQPKDDAPMVDDPNGFWVPYSGSVVNRDTYDALEREHRLLKELLQCRGPVWAALYTALKAIAAHAEEQNDEDDD